MTYEQLEQLASQLPEGEHFKFVYRAWEGDIRIVSTDTHGNEYRYTVRFDKDHNATIERR